MKILIQERFQAAPDWDGMEIYKVSNSKDKTGPGQRFSFASLWAKGFILAPQWVENRGSSRYILYEIYTYTRHCAYLGSKTTHPINFGYTI